MKTTLMLMLCLLPGCTHFSQRESYIITPKGETYRVVNQQDGNFRYKDQDVEITVDNRGRPSVLENAWGATLLGVSGIAANRLKTKMEE